MDDATYFYNSEGVAGIHLVKFLIDGEVTGY